METLSFKEQNILIEHLKEFKDLSKLLDIEIANTSNEIAKSTMIETKYKVLVSIINIDKQRREIFPKQKI